MIRAPWWSWPLAFAVGLALPLLWPNGSDAATDELRQAVERAESEAQTWRTRYESEKAFNDALAAEHEAEKAEAESRIRYIESGIQAAQARAADLAESIRLRVDSATVAIVDELEAVHAEALAAKDSVIAEERRLRLSAEAGWRDARLALVAATEALEASEAAHDSKDALVRALEAQVARANRDKRILALAGIAGVAWGLTK